MFSENLKITFLENSGRIGQIFFFITYDGACDCVCGGQRAKVRGQLVEVSFFSFHHEGPGIKVRFSGKLLYLLGCLASPEGQTLPFFST